MELDALLSPAELLPYQGAQPINSKYVARSLAFKVQTPSVFAGAEGDEAHVRRSDTWIYGWYRLWLQLSPVASTVSASETIESSAATLQALQAALDELRYGSGDTRPMRAWWRAVLATPTCSDEAVAWGRAISLDDREAAAIMPAGSATDALRWMVQLVQAASAKWLMKQADVDAQATAFLERWKLHLCDGRVDRLLDLVYAVLYATRTAIAEPSEDVRSADDVRRLLRLLFNTLFIGL